MPQERSTDQSGSDKSGELVPVPTREITPHALNSRLSRLQRRLPIEAVATPVIGATSLPLLYLGMAEYYGTDPKMFAALTAFKIVCVGGVVGTTVGAVRILEQTVNDVRERTSILSMARERGLQIRGIVFKRLGL